MLLADLLTFNPLHTGRHPSIYTLAKIASAHPTEAAQAATTPKAKATSDDQHFADTLSRSRAALLAALEADEADAEAAEAAGGGSSEGGVGGTPTNLTATETGEMGGAPSKRLQDELQLRYAESTVQGRREYNEDRTCVSHPLPPSKKPLDCGQSLFCVMDGHGGEWAAEYVANHLPAFVARQRGYHAGSKEKASALAKAFVYCDARCLVEQESNGEKSGSTAVAVLIDHTDIHVANVGDTRAVLCRAGQAIQLSHDHKPEDSVEKSRMESAGAKVPSGSGYVELGDKALAVARAFGNPSFKSNPTKPIDGQVIIPHPYQSRTARQLGLDEFLVAASDGLWNVMSNQYVVEFIRKRLLNGMDVEDIAHKLTQHALDRKSQDNVSLILVTFPPAFQPELLARVPLANNNEANKPATS